MSAQTTIPFWWMTPDIHSSEAYLKLHRKRPPQFKWVNMLDCWQVLRDGQFMQCGLSDIPRISQMPLPAYRVSTPSFHPNLIWSAPDLYSAALREAMGLPDEVIQYLAVNTEACDAAFQAMDYRMAHPLKTENVIDLSASGYEPYHELDENGELVSGWRRNVAPDYSGIPEPGMLSPVVYQPDPQYHAPLFIARWVGKLLVTDALADRILQSGITDVHFHDLSYCDPAMQTVRLKTREGLAVVNLRELLKQK